MLFPHQLPSRKQLAAVALDNVTRAFPYAAHHVQASADDLRQPGAMHTAFANSFDWHSSVHMHLLLVRLVEAEIAAGESSDQPWVQRGLDVLTEHLSADGMAAEAAYLRENPSWERPYGWAWAAELAAELHEAQVPQLRALAASAQQLAQTVFDLTIQWLAVTPAPVRHGLHTNTAFGLRRIRGAAQVLGRDDVISAVDAAARRFYAGDRAWPFGYERSGQDFLSPGLCEADLMIEVLSAEELREWLPEFLSVLTADSPVLRPLTVLDPTDGYQSHLYGLGLTVAASLIRTADVFAQWGDTDRAEQLRTAVPGLMEPGLEAAVSDEYMSSHWIATFAWEALREAERNVPGADSVRAEETSND